MKVTLLIIGLLCGSQLANANPLSWLEGQQPGHHDDLPQSDDPEPITGLAGRVQTLLGAMKDSFVELANKRSSWFDRYDVLAQDAANHTAMIEELLEINRITMPILWMTFMANSLIWRAKNIQHGGHVYYEPPNKMLGQTVPHPLRILPTKLTDQEDFVVEITLTLLAEENVGIRLMFEPEGGGRQNFNWDNDDIFLSVHLRWNCVHENDREVVLNDKYNRRWGPEQAVTTEEHWPDLKVGEKFLVVIIKTRECFDVFVALGKDIYVQLYREPQYMHVFCPKPRRRSRMIADPKALRIVVNEDHPGTGELQVENIAWYPFLKK